MITAHTFRLPSTIAAALALIAMATLPSFAAAPAPSIDPTYGLPITHTAPSADKAPPVFWIWAAKTSDNQTVFLRRTFDLTALPKSANLYINADDEATLYVNGQVQKQLPFTGTVNTWEQTQKYDVTSLLKAGKNIIAVQGHNDASAAGIALCLIVDGKQPVLSDTNWKASDDATAPDGWTDLNYDDSTWPTATAVAPVGGGLWASVSTLTDWPLKIATGADYMAHLDLPFTAVTQSHEGAGKIEGLDQLPNHITQFISVTPAPLANTDQPSVVVDFGKEIAGRVVIDSQTPGTIIVSRGESLDEALEGPWHGPVTLTLVPSAVNATDYSAFRYVRLQFPASADAPPAPIKFRVFVDHKYYPVQYLGSFNCSDPMLTKIWYTGAYTSHLCMQEDIWDAPKRDRAKWVGDLHVSGEVINNVFADKFLMEQTLNHLRDDAGNGDVNGIPGYSCAWIACLADFHRHLGDYKFLNSQHDRLVSLLEHLRGDLDSRGIVTKSQGSWMYTDWSPGFDGDTPLSEATTHLFLTKAVNEAVFLLTEMGDQTNADKYAAWAKELTGSAHQYLADSTTNTYSNRLQENAMAIISGVATADQKKAIYSAVLDPASPSWNRDGALLGNKPVMSPYYGNYIIAAMSIAGHTDGALKIVRDFWGGMIDEGATTFWEAYDPNWPKTDFHKFLQADDGQGYFVSLCHGWSSGPTNLLTERVLGVRSTGAAFKTVDIVPDLSGLTWVEGDVPTPRGLIHVRADSNNGAETIQVKLPAGTIAAVGFTGSKVKVNGKSAAPTLVVDGVNYVTIGKEGSFTINVQ